MPVQRSLDLYMISDSGRASVCTNFGIFFRFSRFSPFAEEGFTCLDHSAMSKKKYQDEQDVEIIQHVEEEFEISDAEIQVVSDAEVRDLAAEEDVAFANLGPFTHPRQVSGKKRGR